MYTSDSADDIQQGVHALIDRYVDHLWPGIEPFLTVSRFEVEPDDLGDLRVPLAVLHVLGCHAGFNRVYEGLARRGAMVGVQLDGSREAWERMCVLFELVDLPVYDGIYHLVTALIHLGELRVLLPECLSPQQPDPIDVFPAAACLASPSGFHQPC